MSASLPFLFLPLPLSFGVPFPGRCLKDMFFARGEKLKSFVVRGSVCQSSELLLVCTHRGGGAQARLQPLMTD
jgi:hypothetical protein